MAIPTFAIAGTAVDTTGGSPTPAYPAGLQADDIGIALYTNRTTTDTSASLAFPGDWNRVAGIFQGPAQNQAWAWKRLDGTETGGVSMTGGVGGGVVSIGCLYIFRGCITTGTPFESNTQTGADDDTVASSAINTLGTDRRIVCLGGVSDDNTLGNLTGSNVTWNLDSQFNTTTGLDATIGIWSAPVAAVTTPVTAGSFTMVAADEWASFTFALIPAVAAYQPRYGYVNYQDPGVF